MKLKIRVFFTASSNRSLSAIPLNITSFENMSTIVGIVSVLFNVLGLNFFSPKPATSTSQSNVVNFYDAEYEAKSNESSCHVLDCKSLSYMLQF